MFHNGNIKIFAGEETDRNRAHNRGDTHMFAHNRKLPVKSLLWRFPNRAAIKMLSLAASEASLSRRLWTTKTNMLLEAANGIRLNTWCYFQPPEHKPGRERVSDPFCLSNIISCKTSEHPGFLTALHAKCFCLNGGRETSLKLQWRHFKMNFTAYTQTVHVFIVKYWTRADMFTNSVDLKFFLNSWNKVHWSCFS